MIINLSPDDKLCLFVCCHITDDYQSIIRWLTLFVCLLSDNFQMIIKLSTDDQQMIITWSTDDHQMISFVSLLSYYQQMIIKCLFVCLLSDNQHMIMKWSSNDHQMLCSVWLFVCSKIIYRRSSNDQQMITRSSSNDQQIITKVKLCFFVIEDKQMIIKCFFIVS